MSKLIEFPEFALTDFRQHFILRGSLKIEDKKLTYVYSDYYLAWADFDRARSVVAEYDLPLFIIGDDYSITVKTSLQ